ncbi:MAG: choice-of-anchor A family protein [Clostridiales bacterium]|nr:choice-of-anchor A family protein [Candidatus Blautia equi]
MKRRNNLVSRILAFCLSGAMLLNSSGVQVLAEELMAEPSVAAEIVETEAEPEAAPQAEAPVEESAPAAVEPEVQVEEVPVVQEEAPKAEEPAAEEAEAPEEEKPEEAEAEEIEVPEIEVPETEEAEAAEEETEEEVSEEEVSEEEIPEEAEAEEEETPETEEAEEAEKAELSASVKETLTKNEDEEVSMAFEIAVQNLSETAAAEDIDVKVVLVEDLTYDSEKAHTDQLSWLSDISFLYGGEELEEYFKLAPSLSDTYTSAIMWKDQDIAAQSEVRFTASVKVDDEITEAEDLKALFFVDGELIPSYKVTLAGAEALEKKEPVNEQTEYVFTDGFMTVTATLSSPEILPAGATFVVEEVLPTEEEIALVEGTVDEELIMTGYVTYDMHFEVDGVEVEPDGGEVSVSVTYQAPVELTPVESEEAEQALEMVEKDEETELTYSIVHLNENDGLVAEMVAEDLATAESGEILGAEFSVENFSRFMLFGAAPRKTPIPNSNDSFPYSYSLTNLLSGYNVIAFGDAEMTIHCMGGVLVQGDYNLSGSGFGDGSDLPPSYIKGKANIKGPYNSRNSTTNGPLYLGSVNASNGYINDGGIAVINGVNFYNAVPVYISDNFFDFGRAYSVVTSGTAYLANNGYTINDTGMIDIPFGSSVVIPDISQIYRINFTGSEDVGGSTVVTILNGGRMPEIRFNGSQPSVKEKSEGTSIVWNLPNASGTVSVPAQNWVGHILAPNADVRIEGGNYNGCVICHNFFSNAEGHQYPYNGGTLIPTDLELHLTKTVDGIAPSAEEYGKFTFYLDELKRPGAIKPWDNVKTTTNGTAEGNGDVNFGKLLYDQGDEGTHWYRMYEDQTPVKGYILDKEVFYMKVVVESVQSGADIKYRVANKSLYKAADLTTDVYDLAGGIDVDKLTSIKDTDLSFENSTENTPAELDLGGKKTLFGRTLIPGEFTFSLQECDKSGKVIGGGYQERNVPCDKDGNFMFSRITFEESGTYYYLITEDEKAGAAPVMSPAGKPIYDGVEYDNKKILVTVTVESDGNHGLVATADPKNTAITFENIYRTEGSVILDAKKSMAERTLKDKEFTFSLQQVEANGQKIGDPVSAKNRADGSIVFPEISYKMAGTYYYKLAEAVPADGTKKGTTGNGNPYIVTYDNNVYDITVTATDDGKGHLNTSKKVSLNGKDVSAAEFKNTFDTNTKIRIEGTKSFAGRNLKDGEFFFAICDAAGSAVTTYNVNGGIMNQITNKQNGSIDFGFLKYSLADLKNADGTIKNSKEFTYKVSEIIPAEGEKGVSYDDSVYTVKVLLTYDKVSGELTAALGAGSETPDFENSFITQASATITGTKVLKNKDLEDDEFTFQIKDKEGKLVGVGTNDKDGKIHFYKAADGKATTTPFKITITLADMQKDPADASRGYADEKFFTYTVKEVKGGNSSIVYDEAPQALLLVAKYDADAGKINLHWGNGISSAAFTNTYKAGTRIPVDGTKTLTGRKMKAGEFSFKIFEEDGTTPAKTYKGETPVTEIKNAADGSISFGDLVYTLEDLRNADGSLKESRTFTYVIKEVKGTAKGVKYDAAVKTVKVELKYDQATGALTADYTADSDKIAFTNSYDVSVKLNLDAKKRLEGRDMTAADAFFFEVLDEAGKPVVTNIKAAADGSIDFGQNEFRLSDMKKAGTEDEYESSKIFKFTVREMIPAEKAEGITYDTTEYPFEVTVTYDYATGKMEAVLSDEAKGIQFVNKYDTEAKAKITVKKTLIGAELHADEFTFVILDGDKVIAKGTNDVNGEVVFHPVDAAENMLSGEYEFTVKLSDMKNGSSYEPKKDFFYTVKEVIPAVKDPKMTYDESAYVITLAAAYDAATGKLTADFKDGSKKVEFMNIYEAAGSVPVEGTKILTGRELRDSEFRFDVSSAEQIASGVFEKGANLYYATNDKSGNILFRPFSYTLKDMEDGKGGYAASKTWYVHISEVPSTEKGITYSDAEYIVEVTVKYNGTEDLDVQITDTLTKENGNWVSAAGISFENKYDAQTTEKLDAVKKLDNLDLQAEDFSFDLYAVGAEYAGGKKLLGTFKNDADGYVDFGTFSYELEDLKTADGYLESKDYTYLAVEKPQMNREVPGTVTYDENEITFTVTVSYNKVSGVMSTSRAVAYSNPNEDQKKAAAAGLAEFDNSYDTEAEIGLDGKKDLIGRPLKAEEFTFVVKDDEGNEIGRGTNAADGTITFKDAEGKNLSISKALKDLEGKDSAEFKYTVEEEKGTDADMTYDPSVKTLTLGASYAKDTGKLTLQWTKDSDKAEFTNIYNSQTHCYLEGRKELVNRELKNKEFVFDVYDPATYTKLYSCDKEGNQIDTIYNDADGKVVMGWQKYTLSDLSDGKGGYLPEKTFVYGVTESRRDIERGITLDRAFYQIYVTLAYFADTKELKCGITKIESGEIASGKGMTTIYEKDIRDITEEDAAATPLLISFTNTYDADVREQVIGQKIAPQLTLQGEDFAFTLTDSEGNAYVTKDASGNDIEKITNNASGQIDFGYFAYDLKDVYEDLKANDWTVTYDYFTEEEKTVKPDLPGTLTMDDAEYKISVTLTYDQNTGDFNETVDLFKKDADGEYASADAITFVNTYDTEVKLPIVGYKELSGRELKRNEFTVGLFEAGKEDGDPIKTASNGDAPEKPVDELSGTFDFVLSDLLAEDSEGNPYYLTEKVFHYIIKEIIPAGQEPVENVSYDADAVSVDVTVRYDKAAGEMTAEYENVTVNERKMTFYNAYSAEKSVPVTAAKKLIGRDLTEGEFFFAVYNEQGTLKLNTVSKADGTVDFGSLEYTLADMLAVSDEEKAAAEDNGGYVPVKTFIYNIVEQNSGEENIVYDDTVFRLEVTVTYDWHTGEMTAESTDLLVEDEDGNWIPAEKAEFINIAEQSVKVSKVDASTQEELEGAHIQLIDSEGNVVDEWDSEKEAHEVTGLMPGEEYTLKETVAPLGYDITNIITFTILEDGTVETTANMTSDGVLLVEDTRAVGKIRVSKKLEVLDEEEEAELEEAGFKLYARDYTCYVGLFLDKEGTKPYGNPIPIHVAYDWTGTAEFTNVAYGNYYVYETTADGTAILTDEMFEDGDATFMCIVEDADSSEVELTPEQAENEVGLINMFFKWPGGHFFIAELDITKEIRVNGKTVNTDETFYAGVFSDPNLDTADVITTMGVPSKDDKKKIVLDDMSTSAYVHKLNNNGTVRLGGIFFGELDDTETYWVFETDASGKKIKGAKGFKYEVSGEGSVLLNPRKPASITITNSVNEKTPTPTPPAPKTGDNSGVEMYFLLMGAALAAMLVSLYEKRRRQR